MKAFTSGLATVLGLLSSACGQEVAEPPGTSVQRARMVTEQIERRGIKDPRLLAALRKVPRQEFMPVDTRDTAYDDRAIAIGYGQTISQPYVVAFMTEALNLKPEDKVLEIGTGSGYQAAILAELVKEVYTIEIVEPLGKRAADTLTRLEYKNVQTRIGDGFRGWPAAAPFNAIIVTCAPDAVPQPLVDQLADGGRMIIPVGPPGEPQNLVLLQKTGGKVEQQKVLPVTFVPMTGEAKK
jgi:protein-L-isoaspartate(D-aspartate) O-methyltransferase